MESGGRFSDLNISTNSLPQLLNLSNLFVVIWKYEFFFAWCLFRNNIRASAKSLKGGAYLYETKLPCERKESAFMENLSSRVYTVKEVAKMLNMKPRTAYAF